MEFLQNIFYLYWNTLLGYPLALFENVSEMDMPVAVEVAVKIVLTLVLLFILLDVLRRSMLTVKRAMGRDHLVDDRELAALNQQLNAGGDIDAPVAPVQNLDATIARLKQDRNYLQMAEAYASVNRHKEAARWYRKGGDKRQSAFSLARAGKPLKGAKLLQRLGDHEGAAGFYGEGGKHVLAAKAYAQAGKLGLSGKAYAAAGDQAEALKAYSAYFNESKESIDRQIEIVDACMGLLRDKAGQSKITDELKTTLFPALGARLEQAKRYDESAQLYRHAGDLVRAGEAYVLAGKLQEAAQCMRQAGKEKEAANIVGRFHEKRGEWQQAAAAYAKSGDFLHAGECFNKAADMARAAECFERAKEFYRSGLAYAHAARFKDTIRVLQQLKESSPNYDESRALLGRSFYELHDYAHCAAALDNHLTGKRVDSSNIEYFYMLALAYEQLGKLDESREIFYKIRTVNTQYRDVSQRISNISSRISMQSGVTQVTPAPYPGGGTPAGATPMMQSVENSLEGRYELQKELGRGGMGVVYMARDKQLDRPVALKFLGSLIDNSEEYRQRFVREARTAAKISHPNVISIYDISASVGKAYIAMEYIEGPSLHKYILTNGAMEPRHVINIMVQAASALAVIHEAGIVHRDIKPDNILIAKGGLVKVMDFGLAKAEDSRMTRTGVVMGTPSYMSPEQVLGKEADPRSDVYSLGLVLYECLTGETLFRTGDVLERQLKEVPPPPSTKSDKVTEALDKIVMKCIEKEPPARYQTMNELVAALRGLKV